MLLRQMRYFAAVVDCGSFTEAAARCYISQSAISQQIRALEQELGTPLIHRENRRFSLTPAGELFYPRCKQLLKEADDLVQEMRSIAAGSGARLRIGYLRCYSGSELSQAVADFSLCCPEVSISTVSGTHEELYELLRTEKADIILSDQRRAFSDVYVNDELMQCGCYAELSIHDPLAAQDKVSVEELRRLPCILIASAQQQDTEQGVLSAHAGIRRQLSVCGRSGGRTADGHQRPRLSAGGGRRHPACGKCLYPAAPAVSKRRADQTQLLRVLEKGADERAYRDIREDAEDADPTEQARMSISHKFQ